MFFFSFFTFYFFFFFLPPVQGQHTLCQGRKKKRENIFPFIALSCRLGHKQTSTPESFIYLRQPTTVASRQCQGFILQATSQPFFLKNPHHSFLSYTLLHACPTFKNVFFRQSLTKSIHLFRGRPTKRLPTHTLPHTPF